MSRGVLATVLLVAIALVAAIWSVVNTGLPVQVAEVKRGEIREYIDERGKTRVPRLYQITTPQAGRIQEIDLPEGSHVEQGQVLAQIVTDDLENEVDEARAVVERLDAAIIENDDVAVERSLASQAAEFVESMNNTVEAAKAQMEASEKRAEYAETSLGRAQRLQGTGAVAEEALDQATLQYWEGQLGFRENTLTVESMKSIRAATALLPQMVADYIAHKGLTRGVLEKQKAEAQARLRQVMTQRERGVMRSPVSGVILHRHVENEQHLPAGTQLLTIGQLDALEVETEVLSQDVVQVRPGQLAEIYGPVAGRSLGQGVAGRVHQIYPAGFTKISSLGVEQQRVRVIVRLDSSDNQQLRENGVGVDYRVRVRITTREQTDALIVPRTALFRGPAGQWQLFVAHKGRARLCSVTVGLMNDMWVQVTDGLEEGQKVIVAPESNLAHQTRIRPIEL